MWRSGLGWLHALRKLRPRVRPGDRADMGVEFGLDASLESSFPPLMDFGDVRQGDPSDAVRPFGTDQRSRFA